jgi:hypothetical protein
LAGAHVVAHTTGNKSVNAEDGITEDVLLTHKQTHYFLWFLFPVGLLFVYRMVFDSQKSLIASESKQNKC